MLAFSNRKIQLRGNAILIYEPFAYPERGKQTISPSQYMSNKELYNLILLDSGGYKIEKKKKLQDEETYTGKLSNGAKKRMSRAISLLIQASTKRKVYNPLKRKYYDHQLSFITLTIPSQEHIVTLSQGYRDMLKPYLTFFRDTKKINTYVWKAEIQMRGQIHYHITTPSWIHKDVIRNKWNYLLNKADLMGEYKLKYKNNNPPSTRIDKVWNMLDIQHYMTKEFLKNVQNNHKEGGKLWDCSTNLKGTKYYSIDVTEWHEKK